MVRQLRGLRWVMMGSLLFSTVGFSLAAATDEARHDEPSMGSGQPKSNYFGRKPRAYWGSGWGFFGRLNHWYGYGPLTGVVGGIYTGRVYGGGYPFLRGSYVDYSSSTYYRYRPYGYGAYGERPYRYRPSRYRPYEYNPPRTLP